MPEHAAPAHAAPSSPRPTSPRPSRLLWWSLAVLLLGTTAALYAQADVVFDIATRMWTCL